MDERERIDVLFIAGTGRSGSTILDRIVGANEGFCSVGELRNVWKLSFVENHLCGCGRPFRECPFWGEVCERAFGVPTAEFDVSGPIELKRAVDRLRYVPWLASGLRPPRYRRSFAAYGELLESFYAAILAVSGDRVVVDSTKDPTQAMLLARLPRFRLHVVHLVRDARAVAFSWQRVRQHPGVHWKRQDMTVHPARSSGLRWLFYNGLAELLAASPASYRRLRYEDLVASPVESLSRILAPYGKDLGAAALAATDQLDLAPTHTVSGNPVRFKHGKLELRVDDEWRTALPRRDRLAVSAIDAPLLARYGYPLRGA